MLVLYDAYEDHFYGRRLGEVPLTHLASELVEAYGYLGAQDMEAALGDAFVVCVAMDIPISTHFRKVYIHGSSGLSTDWLLSDLGSYLLLMNGDVHNPFVAKARLYVASGRQASASR